MYIVSYIEYEYNYYKNVLIIISNKQMHGTWISEIERRLLEDNPRTIQEVLLISYLKKQQKIELKIGII